MVPTPESERDARRALLHEALDLSPEQRAEYLRRHIPDERARAEALELLRAAEDVGDFLERPAAVSPTGGPMPKQIGAYSLERPLGYGAMGVVYLAHQAAPARPVALKLLRTDQSSAAAMERFRREAEVLARLAHSGIARVYEVGTSDLGAGPQPWIAMEYIAGRNLLAHVAEAQLDRRARVALVIELARALAHAHAAGVVHRDLKPDNILVRPSGAAVILDFGVARISDDASDLTRLTGTGQVIGTLSYMAPEQARGMTAGAAADQYALGAILYELLSGHLPLDVRGRMLHQALQVIAEGYVTRISKYDPSLAGDLEAIVTTALADEPNRRYPDVSAFADDLQRWLDGEPVRARRVNVLEAVARSIRRRPLITLGVAAGLVVLSVAATLTLESVWRRAHSERVAQVFADRALLSELQEEETSLWPADSTRLDELESWLERAAALTERGSAHRDWRGHLDNDEGARATTDWLRQQLDELLAGLEAFRAEGSILDSVRRRHRRASTLRHETVTLQEAAWQAAAARVALDPRFADVKLEPVEGLVPLGPDPRSGLEEFAVLATGSLPKRASPSAAVRPASGDAVVLVLIPGGSYLIGAQNEDPRGPNHIGGQADYAEHYGPPFRVEIEPYFIGKFELTQDQWSRMHGRNPSYFDPGHASHGVIVTDLHPVEAITCLDVNGTLPRYGLCLPTEVQWEVGARGGTDLPYISSAQPEALIGYANFDSQTEHDLACPYPLASDGYFMTWPVGTGEPNPYGLYDVLGNVSEICSDTYKVHFHELQHRRGDGLVLAEPDGDRSRRGGGMCHSALRLSVYMRSDIRFDNGDSATGVRVARPLR